MGQESSEQLADAIRQMSAAVAVEVTEAFLTRHPDWRLRYGARATTAGVQDAGYHIAFLAGAVASEDRDAFAAYARWAARVLVARGIAQAFLRENLEQIRDAIAARMMPVHAAVLTPYFAAALEPLSDEPELPVGTPLALVTEVFLQAILTGQRHAAVQIAKDAMASGLSLQDLYVDVFQSALYEVGARWEANRLSVAQEHMATAITQYVMAQIYEAPDERLLRNGSVVLTGVEGELHSIGAVMVGDLLESSGWRVRFLGTNLPAASVLGVLREATPSHIGISTTMLFNVPAVRQLITSIRAEFQGRVTVVVGGAAFRVVPNLWREVAADAFAADLRGVQTLFARPS
jgi:methanogenic corrinoid protein MtbC1